MHSPFFNPGHSSSTSSSDGYPTPSCSKETLPAERENFSDRLSLYLEDDFAWSSVDQALDICENFFTDYPIEVSQLIPQIVDSFTGSARVIIEMPHIIPGLIKLIGSSNTAVVETSVGALVDLILFTPEEFAAPMIEDQQVFTGLTRALMFGLEKNINEIIATSARGIRAVISSCADKLFWVDKSEGLEQRLNSWLSTQNKHDANIEDAEDLVALLETQSASSRITEIAYSQSDVLAEMALTNVQQTENLSSTGHSFSFHTMHFSSMAPDNLSPDSAATTLQGSKKRPAEDSARGAEESSSKRLAVSPLYDAYRAKTSLAHKAFDSANKPNPSS